MKCVNHPERLAEYTCVGCGKPFCSECIEIINNEPFCKECAQERARKEVEKRDTHKRSQSKIPIIGRLTRSGKVALIAGILFFLLSAYLHALDTYEVHYFPDFILIGIICVSIIVWIYRDSKARAGRCSGLIWWCFLANPLLGWLIYLIGRPRGTLAPCPNCGERKRVTDTVCPYCGVSGKILGKRGETI